MVIVSILSRRFFGVVPLRQTAMLKLSFPICIFGKCGHNIIHILKSHTFFYWAVFKFIQSKNRNIFVNVQQQIFFLPKNEKRFPKIGTPMWRILPYRSMLRRLLFVNSKYKWIELNKIKYEMVWSEAQIW